MFTDPNPSIISNMDFKQFCEYCEDRCCDGQWPLDLAIVCIDTIRKINNIKYKKFGILMRKKTDTLREQEWQKCLNEELKEYFIFISQYYYE